MPDSAANDPSPPSGWDQVEESYVNGMREFRKLYLGALAVGFTESEAIRLIGAVLATNIANNSVGGAS